MATALACLLTLGPQLASAVPPFRPPPDVAATLPFGWERGFPPSTSNLFIQRESPGDLVHCLLTAKLETMTSSLNGTAAYWDAAQSDNLRFHYHPEAIVYPRSAQEVSSAVRCVATESLRTSISARSGGHSFAAYGSGGWDGSLIIDLQHLDTISYDAKSGTAVVGPAARLGDVVKGLWKDGVQRAMPHGTCPPVGVGGHALCGGFGPTSRQWGMTTDNILEAEVVLANGTVVRTNPHNYPELLWGLRGAGSNFGIVTSLTFQTYDAAGPWVFTEMRWSPSLKTGGDVAKVVHAAQSLATDEHTALPRSYGFHVQLQPSHSGDPPGGPLALHMRGVWHGSQSTWEQQVGSKLSSILSSSGAPQADAQTVKTMSYLEIMEEWDDFGKPGDKLDTLAERLVRNNFLARTRLTRGQRGFEVDTLRVEIMEGLLQRAQRGVGGEPYMWNVYMEMYGGGGQQVGARHRDADVVKASSFPHRDALWLIQSAVGTWGGNDLPEHAHDLLDEVDESFARALKRDGLEDDGFPCYVDARLDAEKATARNYGEETAKRLRKLKEEADPHNVLRNPQAVAGAEYLEEAKPLSAVALRPVRPSGAHPLPR